ncbi:hypothetical protein BDW74DRAFT_175129 [Aspergillus multicolor]|uniref:uncharacterized protein n=1 Tax=Aspergillus multicolor TaxID=41759 RepID=UPI003CCDB6D9
MEYKFSSSKPKASVDDGSLPIHGANWPRVDAILHDSLARALGVVRDSVSARTLQVLVEEYERIVNLPITFAKPGDVLQCAEDYREWNGGRDKADSEANLVLFRLENANNLAEECWSAQAIMSPIMRWFDKLEKSAKEVYRGLHRHPDPKFEEALTQLVARARQESEAETLETPESGIKQEKKKEKEKKKEYPYKAVTDLEPGHVHKIFGLEDEMQSPAGVWNIQSSEERQLPEHAKKMLDDYDLLFHDRERHEAEIRSRVDTILVSILAERKRQDTTHGHGNRISTSSTSSFKSLHWQYETLLRMPWKLLDGKTYNLGGRLDYSLLYGRCEEAETNVVMVEAKTFGESSGGEHQALSYMAMLHHARKKAGRSVVPIYGISTDSYLWTFIRLDSNRKVLRHSFRTNEYRGETMIVSLLHRILSQAAELSRVSSAALTPYHTVEEMTGIEFTDPIRSKSHST